MDSTDSVPTIVIKRDWQAHRWVYAEMGSHLVTTPFTDDAPADHVARWLRTHANGRLRVQVDLS